MPRVLFLSKRVIKIFKTYTKHNNLNGMAEVCPAYQREGPTIVGGEVVSLFGEQGVAFKITEDLGGGKQRISFYNDSPDEELDCECIFGPESEVEAIGDTKQDGVEDDGSKRFKVQCMPGATAGFVEGTVNGTRYKITMTGDFYESDGPKAEGNVTKLFKDGRAFRVVEKVDEKERWWLYNDTKNEDLIAKWWFGPESELEEFGVGKYEGLDENGWLQYSAEVPPGQTLGLCQGTVNGFRCEVALASEEEDEEEEEVELGVFSDDEKEAGGGQRGVATDKVEEEESRRREEEEESRRGV